jgi:SNF2 family DNA or RNA helicase
LNPHQIDAALFAFSSPLSKGALLADEVGLGKTIEAGLIISQNRELSQRLTARRLKLGVSDAERTAKAIKGIVGKHLTYRRPHKVAQSSGY